MFNQSSTRLVSPLDLAHPIIGVPLLIALFAVTYFEPLSVFGIKVAILWRASLIIPALIYLYLVGWEASETTRRLRPLFVAWSLYSIAPVLAVIFGSATVDEGLSALAQRIVPLVAVLLLLASRGFVAAEGLLRALPMFLCLVAPFILMGWLSPTGTEFSLDHLGAESVKAYIGTFQNQHSAALAHSIGALVAWDVYARSRPGSATLYLALSAACLLLCTLTTARAGLAGLLLGMMVIAVARRQARLFIVPMVGLIAMLALVLIIDPDVMSLAVERLMGRTIYQDAVTLDSFTSGRIMLQFAGLAVLKHSAFFDLLFGVGEDRAAFSIGRITGLQLMAHNVFIDEALRYGLVGLTGLLAALAATLRLTFANYRSGYPLGLALFIALIVFAFFQSLDYSFQLILIACVIALDCTFVNAGSSAQAGSSHHGRSR